MPGYQYQNGQYPEAWYSQDPAQSGQYPAQQYGQYPQYQQNGQMQQYPQYQQAPQTAYQQNPQADFQQPYQQSEPQYQQAFQQYPQQAYADSGYQYQQAQYSYPEAYSQQAAAPAAPAATKKPNPAMMAISRILVIIGSVILVASLLATIGLVAPRLFGIMPYTVLTGSMEPAVPVGSLVYVQDASGDSLNKGDIVTFSKAASGDGAATAVTHRVESNNKAKSELTTKGDANDAADPQAVPYANILGKVVLTVPVVGSFVASLDTWNGKVAMIAIVLGGLIFCLVGDQLRRAAKRAARKA